MLEDRKTFISLNSYNIENHDDYLIERFIRKKGKKCKFNKLNQNISSVEVIFRTDIMSTTDITLI